MDQQKPSLDALRIDRTEAAARRTGGWIAGVVLLLAIVGGVYFLYARVRLPEVRVATVKETVASDAAQPVVLLNASGYVVARRQATVSAKITAKVMDVLIEEGMRVTNGQVLARLDDSNVRANLRLAEAQLAAARAALEETRVRLDEARKEYQRIRRLASEQVATQSELDRAEAEVKSLEARLQREQTEVGVAERQVAVWQQQLDDTIIRAPFDGVVVSKDAQPGEMISPVSAGGGFTRTGIGTIVDMTSLEIEVDVNESYIKRVHPNQRVVATLDAYPEWKIPCHVIALIPTADRQKATVKVRIALEQTDPRILPEMGVKVAFLGEPTPNAPGTGRLLVPLAAVREARGRQVVCVVNGGKAELRPVKLAEAEGDWVPVLAGLDAGERVVVEGPADLADGDRVRVVEQEQ